MNVLTSADVLNILSNATSAAMHEMQEALANIEHNNKALKGEHSIIVRNAAHAQEAGRIAAAAAAAAAAINEMQILCEGKWEAAQIIEKYQGIEEDRWLEISAENLPYFERAFADIDVSPAAACAAYNAGEEAFWGAAAAAPRGEKYEAANKAAAAAWEAVYPAALLAAAVTETAPAYAAARRAARKGDDVAEALAYL